MEIAGNFLKIPKAKLEKYREYQVIIGFSGFGNVGYLSLTHLIETLDLKSIAFWGHTTWFHKNRLESLLTVFEHEETKTILIAPRLPIHVTTIPQRYWDALATEILAWNCKKYFIIAGLREETRNTTSREWAAYVTTPLWEQKYSPKKNLRDRLAMIGPLSSFISLGTSLDQAVLGILAYCNYEEDPESAINVLKEIERLCNFPVEINGALSRFDFSFVPNGTLPVDFSELEDQEYGLEEELGENDENDDDDLPGYDLNELV